MTQKTHTIQELLDFSDSKIGKLISKAQALDTLNLTLINIIGPDFSQYCCVGGFHLGTLTLFTSNSALATRLRYDIPTILSKLRALPTWAGLCQIQIKIHHPSQAVKPLPQTVEASPPLKISATNATQIRSLAQSLMDKPGMEKLVAVLLKIAEHGA